MHLCTSVPTHQLKHKYTDVSAQQKILFPNVRNGKESVSLLDPILTTSLKLSVKYDVKT